MAGLRERKEGGINGCEGREAAGAKVKRAAGWVRQLAPWGCCNNTFQVLFKAHRVPSSHSGQGLGLICEPISPNKQINKAWYDNPWSSPEDSSKS